MPVIENNSTAVDLSENIARPDNSTDFIPDINGRRQKDFLDVT
jgi:hypothetical protein